jgi:hypothetical protein
MGTAHGWLLAAVLLAGCASLGPRAGASAAPPAGVAAAPGWAIGVWEGVVTGAEMAGAAHIVETPARLTIQSDGRWVMSLGAGPAHGTITRQSGDHLVLDGRIGAADGDPNAAPVWYRLKRIRDGFIVGTAHMYGSGHSMEPTVTLRKVA